MNVNYIYPEYYYPVYPEYYYGYYEPMPKPRMPKRGSNSSTNQTNNQNGRDDIDESVKQLIQLSKEQIAKEKVISETKIGTSNIPNNFFKFSTEHNPQTCNKELSKTNERIHGRTSPVIGETNRLAKHIVEILESIYQSSSFVNRKRREEIANELNLPVEKVRNWFQNRRGKDRRQNVVEKIHSRKYVRSGKYARKSDDFIFYDQKMPSMESGSLTNSDALIMGMKPQNITSNAFNTNTTGPGDINFSFVDAKEVVATSPEKVKVGKLAYAVDKNSPTQPSDAMPYWPSVSNWETGSVHNTGGYVRSTGGDAYDEDDEAEEQEEEDDDDELDEEYEYSNDVSRTLNGNATITSTTNQMYDDVNKLVNNAQEYEVIVDKKTNKSYIVLNDTVLDVMI